MLGADFVPREYVTEKLLTLWGDGDKARSILDQMKAEELEKFDGNNPPDVEDDEENLVTAR